MLIDFFFSFYLVTLINRQMLCSQFNNAYEACESQQTCHCFCSVQMKTFLKVFSFQNIDFLNVRNKGSMGRYIQS